MSLHACVIGYGLMGKTHAEMYEKNPNIGQITIVEVDSSKFPAESNRRCQFQDRVYPEDIWDLVSICTPSYLHFPVFQVVIDRAKAVLIEKPLALNSTDAEQIRERAYGNSLLVRCAFVERFNPPIASLKEITQGQVHYEMVRISSTPGISWYSNRGLSGGPLFDLGIHDIDLSLWLTSSDAKVTDAVNKQEVYHIQLLMDNGDSVFIRTGWIDTPDYFENTITVSGLGKRQHLTSEEMGRRRYPEAYQLQIDAFVDTLVHGKITALATLDDAIRAIKLCESIEALVR